MLLAASSGAAPASGSAARGQLRFVRRSSARLDLAARALGKLSAMDGMAEDGGDPVAVADTRSPPGTRPLQSAALLPFFHRRLSALSRPPVPGLSLHEMAYDEPAMPLTGARVRYP